MLGPKAKEALGFRTPGFRTLNNFYESVQWSSPAMGYLIHAPLIAISVAAMRDDRKAAYPMVKRARELAQGFTPAQAKTLDLALQELGYFLNDIYKE